MLKIKIQNTMVFDATFKTKEVRCTFEVLQITKSIFS